MSSLVKSIMARVSLKEDYEVTFSSPQGKRVLAHILKVGHAHATTFVEGDINKTILQEGERRLALSILRQVCKDSKELQTALENHYQTNE